MSSAEIKDFLVNNFPESVLASYAKENDWEYRVVRDNCLLFIDPFPMGIQDSLDLLKDLRGLLWAQILDISGLISFIKNLIHVPGVRGNPQRAYQTSAVERVFPGTFENYIASIIQNWQSKKDKQLLQLTRNLSRLGLTKKIQANSLNEAEVELQVGRSLASGSKEMVSIADVGFGVSQILPVLVALLVAKPEQLVYIEQPEIHLHPRAQVALAEILIDAANRGVRVVIETHSELLLLAIQSLVSENKIRPDQVRLHWFTRLENGASKITSAELDETGAFGDWPEDFGEVSLGLHDRYLSAAEAKLWAAQS